MAKKSMSSSVSSRLNSAMNSRFDIDAPKKELEKVHMEIEKRRRESQREFRREQLVLKAQLDGHKNQAGVGTSSDPDALKSRRSVAVMESGRKISGGVPSSIGTLAEKESSFLSSIEKYRMSDKERQAADVTEQLKMLHEVALLLVQGIEAANQAASSVGAKSTSNKKLEENMEEITSSIRKISKMSTDETVRKSSKKVSAQQSMPESMQYSNEDARASSSLTASSATRPGGALEDLGELIFLLGDKETHLLDPRAMKALTALLEETRNALKQIKTGGDPIRLQMRCKKKLHELTEILKSASSLGNESVLTTEQILNCGYLRLTKKTVLMLEDRMRNQGLDPGIHSHKDIKAFDIFERRDSDMDIEEEN